MHKPCVNLLQYFCRKTTLLKEHLGVSNKQSPGTSGAAHLAAAQPAGRLLVPLPAPRWQPHMPPFVCQATGRAGVRTLHSALRGARPGQHVTH